MTAEIEDKSDSERERERLMEREGEKDNVMKRLRNVTARKYLYA